MGLYKKNSMPYWDIRDINWEDILISTSEKSWATQYKAIYNSKYTKYISESKNQKSATWLLEYVTVNKSLLLLSEFNKRLHIIEDYLPDTGTKKSTINITLTKTWGNDIIYTDTDTYIGMMLSCICNPDNNTKELVGFYAYDQVQNLSGALKYLKFIQSSMKNHIEIDSLMNIIRFKIFLHRIFETVNSNERK